MQKRKVIDAETMKCLEVFDLSELEFILKKYIDLGDYEDVSADADGDIILFKDTE